jgi:hypothetical protein
MMAQGKAGWLHRAARLVRFLTVVIALACQIGCAAAVEPEGGQESSLAALDAATIYCQGLQKDGGHAPHRHHAADPAIVQASAAAAQHVAILGGAPFFVPPSVCRLGRAGQARARAPPVRIGCTAYPRGPPTLI